MAMVLTYGAKVPVVKVGRMAGQFAKPRSAPTETVDGVELPSYRGDIINELRFHARGARFPIRARMLQAYTQAAATLNLLRAFSTGGYADVHQVHAWTLGFTDSDEAEKYREMANRISRHARFHGRRRGRPPTPRTNLQTVDFYTSHEALLLEYEEALCRIDSTTGKWLAGSGHMIWIGDRTRQPDGAHVEFAARRAEPDRPEMRPDDRRPDDLKALMAKLNPENEAGPADPDRALRRGQGGRTPAASDQGGARKRAPMSSGPATRCTATRSNRRPATRPGRSRACCARCANSLRVHNAEGTIPGGVHFEMTGKDVTECTGGVRAVTRRGSVGPLSHRLRSAPERQPVAGTGVSGGRGACRRGARQAQAAAV